MNVACGHNRYAKILAKLVDASRYLLDIVNAAKPPRPDQICIVLRRHDLEVIVEGCDLRRLIIASSREDSPKELPRPAGRPHEQVRSCPVQLIPGYPGMAIEMPQMRKRDQPVKIAKAVAVLYKYCHMVDWRRVVVWIVNEISFNPVNHLDAMLTRYVTGIWECLNDSVIRHSNGRMPPGCRKSNCIFDIAHRIHRTHLGM